MCLCVVCVCVCVVCVHPWWKTRPHISIGPSWRGQTAKCGRPRFSEDVLGPKIQREYPRIIFYDLYNPNTLKREKSSIKWFRSYGVCYLYTICKDFKFRRKNVCVNLGALVPSCALPCTSHETQVPACSMLRAITARYLLQRC